MHTKSIRSLSGVLVWMAAGSVMAAPAMRPDHPVLTPDHVLQLPALDMSLLKAEDLAAKQNGRPLRIGVQTTVKGAGLAAGEWTAQADGSWQWQLRVDAPGGLAMDFTFARFHLPEGASLSIVNGDGSEQIGPFGAADNHAYGELYTPFLSGSEAVLTLRVPAAERKAVELELGRVGRAYRGMFDRVADAGGDLQKSGSCNVDVACPQGDAWREQIDSVAHYVYQATDGSYVCTAQLTNDASFSNNRLLTTANHCIATAAEARSMVVYWGYESPTCRTPGSAASGNSLPRASNSRATQNGATLRATHVDSDFTLVELNADVPAAALAKATGWDRRELIPTRTVSIHHPAGHEKRISLDNQSPLLHNAPVTGLRGTRYWHILAWDVGTTEGGSSGSGLWNQDGRLIGVLSGGEASCGNSVNDFYGRVSAAWEGGGTPATRLRDWLDPFGTGAQFVNASQGSLETVNLSSPAFTTSPEVGAVVAFEVSVSGGTAPYTYEWDLDGDGFIDRRGSANRIEVRFAKTGATNVIVRVVDAAGRSGSQSRTLQVRGPKIEVAAVGAPRQVELIGNDDDRIDPGEAWVQTLRLTNTGNATQTAGNALFANRVIALPFGPSSDGYTGSTTEAGKCDFGWIDLVSGANATAALTTAVGNGNAYGALDDARSATITLGGNGLALYGERHAQAVMSTNGYVSFDASESGGDFSPLCGADYTQGAKGPQLRPYHFDMVVSGSGATPASGAGLRYRYFAVCPRPAAVGGAQGCHVFSWTRMQSWSGGTPVGDFDFQAVAYENSGEVAYQYRNAPTVEGAGYPTIGIADRAGNTAFDLSCDVSPAIVKAASAACVFAPDAQPATRSVAMLPQAVKAVPRLAPGESVELTLPFEVASDAACASALGVDYLGTASLAHQSAVRAQVVDASVAAQCSPFPRAHIGTPPPILPIPRHRGMYFNPLRDGNGLTNFAYRLDAGYRELFGGIWYTALRDRTPVWYTVQGEVFTGAGEVALRRFKNVAAPEGFATEHEIAGRAWVGQINENSVLLAWSFPDGRQGIERMDSAGFPVGSPNHTQTWHDERQPGWGFGVESLNADRALEFFATFIYDAAGQPRWLVGDRAGLGGGTVNLTGFRTHCPACPWIVDWSADGEAAGSFDIRYNSGNSATLDSRIVLPAAYPGSWTRSNLNISPVAEIAP